MLMNVSVEVGICEQNVFVLHGFAVVESLTPPFKQGMLTGTPGTVKQGFRDNVSCGSD